MSYPPALYSGGTGAVSASLRLADVPPDLEIGVRSRVGYLATGTTTGGHYGLYRWDLTGAGSSAAVPRGHYHKTFSESFFVLEGAIGLFNGDQWHDSGPGDFLYVPPGGIHAFRNVTSAPASMLVLFAPGAPREAYFEELAAISASGRQLSPQEWTELYNRHDQYEA